MLDIKKGALYQVKQLNHIFQFHGSVHHKLMNKMPTLMQQFKCVFHLSLDSLTPARGVHSTLRHTYDRNK
jgi:hypothetical protein